MSKLFRLPMSEPPHPSPFDLLMADVTKRVGEIESLRSEFESWISASPFEREIERWPNDESKHAWPGQYRGINVALAWEAWQEAAFIHSLPNAGGMARIARETAQTELFPPMGAR